VLGSVFPAIALEALQQWLKLVAWNRNDLSGTLVAVFALVTAAGMFAAYAHQVLTRRTPVSVLVVVATLVVAEVATNRVSQPFVSPSTTLESGWIDPARVSVTLTPRPAIQQKGRWDLFADCLIAGETPNVVFAPIGVRSRFTVDGQPEVRYAGDRWPDYWSFRGLGARMFRKDVVERLLGGAQLIDVEEAMRSAPTWPIAALEEEDYRAYAGAKGRIEVDIVVGARAYERCPSLALAPGARGRCGDRRIEMLAATQSGRKVLVTVRDAMAAFAMDVRRLSRVEYVLVNKERHAALMFGGLDYYSRYPVFGQVTFMPLAEHLAITWRDLVFEVPATVGQQIPSWVNESVIVPLQIRDIGEFTVRAQVKEDGKTQ
jgi:hypothetical protein